MWQQIRASSLDRHIHSKAYAALVVSGSYEEAGDNGRFQVHAGDVVFHDPFEAHLDRFFAGGAVVLNLVLPPSNHFFSIVARMTDPDAVVRMAEKSAAAAAELLCSSAQTRPVKYADWPDELAATLIRSPILKLSEWGEKRGLAPWSVSRGFAQVFSISPEAFRARARARRALTSIRQTNLPLATIAAELGFADQAHMTRSIRQLTGAAPRAWRSRAKGFKTEGYGPD